MAPWPSSTAERDAVRGDVGCRIETKALADRRGLEAPDGARSQAFYDQTLFWQWMRLPGDVVFSVGTLIMAWDFLVKLRRPRPLIAASGEPAEAR